MRFQTPFSAILLLLGLAVSAQQKSTFVKPAYVPPSEWFSTSSDTVPTAKFVSLESAIRNMSVVSNPDANLPSDYNWRREIRANEILTNAAFQMRAIDCLGRIVQPEMSEFVTKQVLINTASR